MTLNMSNSMRTNLWILNSRILSHEQTKTDLSTTLNIPQVHGIPSIFKTNALEEVKKLKITKAASVTKEQKT